MCGIAGFLSRSGDVPLLEAMLTQIQHRGPERNSTYTNNHVGLGHARLSIIDLEGGWQPIPNEDEALWIICNGEVYDYQAMRERLLKAGHRFRTGSDSEVILHLYEQFGVEGFKQLNGQYAFAIWDGRTNALILCRDRVGICPMYYTFAGDEFYFASEMKALLHAPGVYPEPDLQALQAIWTFWTSPTRTPLKGICEFPTGHYAIIKPNERTLKPERYWQLDFTPRLWRFEDALEAFESTLDDAVRVRLQADVPVGAYLSGGLDSSVTTALGRRHANTLHTFSITFDDPNYDESPQQKVVADYFGTQHHILHVYSEKLAAALPSVVYYTEQPQLRAGPISMFLLSESVRDHNFKVVITGEGADEFLVGYDIFRETAVRRFMSRNPNSVMRRQLTRRLYTYLPGRDKLQRGLEVGFQRSLEQVNDPLFSHMQRWKNTANQMLYFTPEIRAQFDQELIFQEIRQSLPEGFDHWHWLARAQTLEISTFMSAYLLSSQGDRVMMGHAVEGRFPFLDHRLIELANSFPPSFKLRSLKQDKYVLRQMGKKLLPEAIANRPKVPYRTPNYELFKAKAFQRLHDSISDEELRATGFFVPSAVHKLLHKVQNADLPSEMDTMALLGIVTTQLWHQAFVQQKAVASL
jgi:asparagine synthase (glutamine-hydrolysing)